MMSSDWIRASDTSPVPVSVRPERKLVDQRFEPGDVAFGHLDARLVGPRHGQKLIEAQAFLLQLQFEILDLAEHGRDLGLGRQDATLFLQVEHAFLRLQHAVSASSKLSLRRPSGLRAGAGSSGRRVPPRSE
jgi:hypothetical protein